jgi:outer membrane protein insertion porin family
MKLKILIIALITLSISFGAFTQAITGEQIKIDYSNPVEYEIGGITVSGVNYIDPNIVIMVSGLSIGEKISIPGDQISQAIHLLWKQGLFQNVSISINSIENGFVFLDIELKERPRLSRYEFIGLRKSQGEKIEELLNLTRGDVITENLLVRAETTIKDFLVEKGYLKPTIEIKQIQDTIRQNSILLEFNIDKGPRTRIKKINIIGNEELSDWKLKWTMKKTRERSIWFIFSSSKFKKDEFSADKIKIIDKYNEIGKRDARVVRDSIYYVSEKRLIIDLYIDEGPTYYHRDIKFVGNTVYPDELLANILKIETGDIYNQQKLDKNLYMNMDGLDVSSLYLDNGYLFFNIDPVETRIENDSIDLEIRIYEGKQATIKRVSVSGNTKTNDHVIMREIRTRPGQLFSRNDIIRSQRDILQLGYFDQEKLNVLPKPNPADGTVDIEYLVEETSSDQIELSGGWGANRIIGTLGLSFNNFSSRQLLKKDAWRPLPGGDGQKLTLRAQTYGRGYISYSMSFVEPWLGGKKPNSFSISVYQTTHRKDYASSHPDYGYYSILGSSIGLARRLKFPDDYFFLQQNITYQHYDIFNPPLMFIFNKGKSNNLSYKAVFGRNSIDAPLYPRSGSEVSISLQMTPPYSAFTDTDYSDATDQEKYKWLEYHKWGFRSNWFTSLAGNLVLSTRIRFGYLGLYNSDIGISPFERYYLGGDALSGWDIDGREVISLRGYGNYSLTPRDANNNYVGANIYSKYTVELRYPISLNPMATIYALGFIEAGNAWSGFNNFNPFDIKRSSGIGVRVFLPMFGLLGLDWGYGFDKIPGKPGDSGSNFHFSIGHSID